MINQQADYRLIFIADEEVPLASSIIRDNRFFPITVAVMLTLFLMMLAVTYYVQCKKYRNRIAYLSGKEKSPYVGWNLIRLKEEAQEMEWEAVRASGKIWNNL
ncbi:MAG: hypothetical protein J1E83_05800 [Lachnospiraceae bacterium]|nr:hypothetical protein [Lachnospiraceae bacterium]